MKDLAAQVRNPNRQRGTHLTQPLNQGYDRNFMEVSRIKTLWSSKILTELKK